MTLLQQMMSDLCFGVGASNPSLTRISLSAIRPPRLHIFIYTWTTDRSAAASDSVAPPLVLSWPLVLPLPLVVPLPLPALALILAPAAPLELKLAVDDCEDAAPVETAAGADDDAAAAIDADALAPPPSVIRGVGAREFRMPSGPAPALVFASPSSPFDELSVTDNAPTLVVDADADRAPDAR